MPECNVTRYFFYFVHSFMAALESATNVLAGYNYKDLPIVAAIAKNNITGLQFHRERSGPEGLQILKTFVSG